jgi:hypothetical protein
LSFKRSVLRNKQKLFRGSDFFEFFFTKVLGRFPFFKNKEPFRLESVARGGSRIVVFSCLKNNFDTECSKWIEKIKNFQNLLDGVKMKMRFLGKVPGGG